MTNRRSYTPEQKAQAIARVLAGEAVAAVARDMGVERVTLQSWLARHKPVAAVVASVATPATAPVEVSLQAEVATFLREMLRTLTSHAVLYRSPEWVEKQTPDTLLAVDRTLGSRLVSIMDRIAGNGGGGSNDD